MPVVLNIWKDVWGYLKQVSHRRQTGTHCDHVHSRLSLMVTVNRLEIPASALWHRYRKFFHDQILHMHIEKMVPRGLEKNK